MPTIFRRQCDARGSPSKFTRAGNHLIEDARRRARDEKIYVARADLQKFPRANVAEAAKALIRQPQPQCVIYWSSYHLASVPHWSRSRLKGATKLNKSSTCALCRSPSRSPVDCSRSSVMSSDKKGKTMARCIQAAHHRLHDRPIDDQTTDAL